MSDIWKFASNFYVAVATSIYFLLCCIFLNYYFFDGLLEDLLLSFNNNDKYNFILNMFFYFIIPIMTVNYIAVYKNEKYKFLIKKYEKFYNKKIFAIFFLMSVLFIFSYVFSNVEFRYN